VPLTDLEFGGTAADRSYGVFTTTQRENVIETPAKAPAETVSSVAITTLDRECNRCQEDIDRYVKEGERMSADLGENVVLVAGLLERLDRLKNAIKQLKSASA